MCWFEWGVTKSIGRPAVTRGLGFLPGSNSVHYDGEPERRRFYLEAIADGAAPAGWGVDDGVGLLFRGHPPGGGRRLAAGRARAPRARGRRRGGRGGDRAAAAQGARARGPVGAAGGGGAARAACVAAALRSRHRRGARPAAAGSANVNCGIEEAGAGNVGRGRRRAGRSAALTPMGATSTRRIRVVAFSGPWRTSHAGANRGRCSPGHGRTTRSPHPPLPQSRSYVAGATPRRERLRPPPPRACGARRAACAASPRRGRPGSRRSRSSGSPATSSGVPAAIR